MKNVPLDEAVDLVDLGKRTEGFSAADCAALVREAALTAMRESMEAVTITSAHVETALKASGPRSTPRRSRRWRPSPPAASRPEGQAKSRVTTTVMPLPGRVANRGSTRTPNCLPNRSADACCPGG